MCIYVTSVDIKKREFLIYENFEAISMMIWYMNYNLCKTNDRMTSLAPCVRIVNNHTTLLVIYYTNDQLSSGFWNAVIRHWSVDFGVMQHNVLLEAIIMYPWPIWELYFSDVCCSIEQNYITFKIILFLVLYLCECVHEIKI